MPSRAWAPIKFPLHLWFTHVHVSFASVENSVLSVTAKGFEERAATVFEEKRRQTAAMLIINFSINWKYLESSCFYFLQMPRKMGKWLSSVWMTCLKIWNFFWKWPAVVIKSRVVCFSPCSFAFKSLRCYTMSTKNPTVSFIIPLKSWKCLSFSSHLVDFL